MCVNQISAPVRAQVIARIDVIINRVLRKNFEMVVCEYPWVR